MIRSLSDAVSINSCPKCLSDITGRLTISGGAECCPKCGEPIRKAIREPLPREQSAEMAKPVAASLDEVEAESRPDYYWLLSYARALRLLGFIFLAIGIVLLVASAYVSTQYHGDWIGVLIVGISVAFASIPQFIAAELIHATRDVAINSKSAVGLLSEISQTLKQKR